MFRSIENYFSNKNQNLEQNLDIVVLRGTVTRNFNSFQLMIITQAVFLFVLSYTVLFFFLLELNIQEDIKSLLMKKMHQIRPVTYFLEIRPFRMT